MPLVLVIAPVTTVVGVAFTLFRCGIRSLESNSSNLTPTPSGRGTGCIVTADDTVITPILSRAALAASKLPAITERSGTYLAPLSVNLISPPLFPDR